LEDDCDDKAVDTQNTSHNDWNEGSEDQFGSEDTHTANTDTGLGSAVGSAQVAEDQSGGDSHETEEGVLVRVVIVKGYKIVSYAKSREIAATALFHVIISDCSLAIGVSS
jgi:hypothetical protein